jgi:hypothetical protein
VNVLENRAMRTILPLKMNGTIGSWRKLHSEELHNLCSSSNIDWWSQTGWDEQGM